MTALIPKKKLIIYDASAFIHRAWHAGNRTGADDAGGAALSAVTEILNHTRKPRVLGHAVVVCFDEPGESLRKMLYPPYKANRSEKPPELVEQIAQTQEALNAFGIATLSKPGVEADDLIAGAVTAMQGLDVACWVVSPDKDLLQLVGPSCTVYRPFRRWKMAEHDVRVIYGFTADRIADYLALVGDSADNIPGVKRVGDKAAKALISKHDSIEDMLENALPKYRKHLQAHREDLLMSRLLVQLRPELAASVLPSCPVSYWSSYKSRLEADTTAAAWWANKLGNRLLLDLL